MPMICGFHLRFLHRPFLIGFCWTNQKVGKKVGIILAGTSWLRTRLKPSFNPLRRGLVRLEVVVCSDVPDPKLAIATIPACAAVNHLAGFGCLSFGTQGKQEKNYCNLQHHSLPSMPHSIRKRTRLVGVVESTTGHPEVTVGNR
jgi:hypothetical protein